MTVYPNLIGIGAQRSGTTWLDQQLRQHPEVYLPELRKEVHFFDDYYDRGMAWYGRFFADARKDARVKVVGEITPRYLYAPLTASRIARELPDARLIAMLRNPADRAYSHYGLEAAKARLRESSFEGFLQAQPEAFYRGMYAAQIERFQTCFAPGQLLVLIFEEVMANRTAALAEVCRFLGIDDSPANFPAAESKLGASVRPRATLLRGAATTASVWLRSMDLDAPVNLAKRVGLDRLLGRGEAMPRVDPATRDLLLRMYTPDIRRLETLLGRDLSIWLRPAVDVPGTDG